MKKKTFIQKYTKGKYIYEYTKERRYTYKRITYTNIQKNVNIHKEEIQNIYKEIYRENMYTRK